MFRAAVFVFSSILWGQVAFGQAGQATSAMMPYQPNYDALKQALGLTDTQVQALQQIQKNRSTANQAVFQQINAKQTQLNDLLNSGAPDAFAIGQLQIDMANLRKQTNNTPSIRDQALAVLEAGQKAKLANLESVLQLQRAANEAAGLGLIGQPPFQPLRIVPAIAPNGQVTLR